jgi:antitoxin HicB
MKKRRQELDYYLNLRYPLTLVPEIEGGYTVLVSDLPGCMSVGETLSEAMEMIEDARRLWLEVAYEHGDEIPLPETEREYNGKVLVRMPTGLHRRLVEQAKAEGVSLNQHIVVLLSEASTLNALRKDFDKLRGDIEVRQPIKAYNVVQSSHDGQLGDLTKYQISGGVSA